MLLWWLAHDTIFANEKKNGEFRQQIPTVPEEDTFRVYVYDLARTKKLAFAQTKLNAKQIKNLVNLYLFTHFRWLRDVLEPYLTSRGNGKWANTLI